MGEEVYSNDQPLAYKDCKADIFALGVIFYELVDKKQSSDSFFINSGDVEKEANLTKKPLFKKLSHEI